MSAAVAAFTVTAIVLVALLFGAAIAVAVAQERLVERLRAEAPSVKHWGGYVLIAVGVWFLLLAVFVDTFTGLFPV